jgi:hypothetical protein
MIYTRPEITDLNSAIRAILGQPPNSKIGVLSEHTGPNYYLTAAAYEADE